MSEPTYIRVYIGSRLVVEEEIVSKKIIIGEELSVEELGLEYLEEDLTTFTLFSRTIEVIDSHGNIVEVDSYSIRDEFESELSE